MKPSIQIIYAEASLIPSFHKALSAVAAEKIYIEAVEAPELESVEKFQGKLMSTNAPVYYALADRQVVGWCDISLKDNPRMKHRASLGMGIIDGYRGQGVGTQLLEAALKHAKEIGLEKVELQVYASNSVAIALYRKQGFVDEGCIRDYRRLDGRSFDALMMSRIL